MSRMLSRPAVAYYQLSCYVARNWLKLHT